MGIPREVIRSPKLRGIHDFPEKAMMGSAEEALNVDFTDGGPRPRRGVSLIVEITEAGNPELVGKGVWSWRHADGSTSTVVGYLEDVGGGVLRARIAVFTTGGASIASFDLETLVPGPAGGAIWSTLKPWSATTFTPAGYPEGSGFNVFVVATGSPMGGLLGQQRTPGLWALHKEEGGAIACRPITPVDREGTVLGSKAYWDNTTGNGFGVPSTIAGDDAGPYYGDDDLAPWQVRAPIDYGALAGWFVTTYRGRLVVAGFDSAEKRLAIQMSNIGDVAIGVNVAGIVQGAAVPGGWWTVQGWPANAIIHLHDQDSSEITGLSTWRDFLIVWKQRSIHLLRFSGIEDATVLQQLFGQGLASPAGLAYVSKAGRELIFFASEDGIYAWDGRARYISGPIQKRLRRQGGLASAVAVAHPYLNQVWFQLNDRWFVFDYDSGNWSEHEFAGHFDAAGVLYGVREAPVMAPVGLASVPAPGRVEANALRLCHFDAGMSDDAFAVGIAREARWQSQRVAYTRHQVRRWRFLRIDQEAAGGADTATVYWLLDAQTRTAALANGQSTAISPVPGAPGTFGTLTFGNALFGFGDNEGYFSTRVPLHGGPARWFRWGVQSAGTSFSRWHLTSAEFDTMRKEGRR